MVFSEMFLKISQISLGNTCTGYNVNVNVWLYAFSIFFLKETPAHSCFPVSSGDF